MSNQKNNNIFLCLDDAAPLSRVEIASVSGGGEEFQYITGTNSSLVWPGIAHTTRHYITPVTIKCCCLDKSS